MIKVLSAGLYTTIQDSGRKGHRNFGVPESGVMDSISANLANGLLNNNLDCSVLEITQIGPTLEFLEEITIAISGAEIPIKKNDTSILMNKPFQVKKGDIISIGCVTKGIRAYLAVVGGLDSKVIMNSQSLLNGITENGRITKNDVIKFSKNNRSLNFSKGLLKNKIFFYESMELEVFLGPEFNLFSKEQQQLILSTKFTISNIINRMGYRLMEAIFKHEISMITSPVLPGTVQLTPEGKLVILMKDAQTTGGYPRVLQLSKKSIAILAQKGSGDSIKFKQVNYVN